jgi:PAS domain S-box-containing protein
MQENSYSVLVIDDSRMIRAVLKKMLVSWGLDVFLAEDAEKALIFLKKNDVDILLVDINLPGMTGLDLLYQLHLEKKDQVAIVMTSQEDTKMVRNAMDLGAFSYLVKPFQDEDLKSRVERALEIITLKKAQKDYSRDLEWQLRERTLEMSTLLKKVSDREERLAAVIQGMKEGLLALDRKNRVIMMNQAFCSMFHIPKTELHREKLCEVIDDIDLCEKLRNILENESDEISESKFTQKLTENSWRIFSTRLSVIHDENGKISGKVLIVAEQTEKLRVQELRRVFLNNVSHEMRTPLTGMISIITALNNTQLSDEQTQFVKILDETSQILLRQVNSILDFSRLEKGQVQLSENEFSVAALFQNLIERFTPMAVEKGLKIEKDLDGCANLVIVGDEHRLEEVLSNLVQNAIKFTPKGFVKISLFPLMEREKDIHLEFCVKDSGIGIPKEKQISVFKEFVQGDGAATRKYGGSGLGLALVKKVVELMSGSISMESEPGKGSLFRCIVPFKKSKETVKS